MKKIMSPAQLAANQRNAGKSTGPKTAAGKAVSSRNARKHGILARQVIVAGYKYSESQHEFKKMCREYHAHLAPVGPLEAMLVDQIVVIVWRSRRVPMAESGEIALSVDGGCWKRENHDAVRRELAWPSSPFTDVLGIRLRRTVEGSRFLIQRLNEVRKVFEKAGELTEDAVTDFKACMRGHPDLTVNELEALRAQYVANPDHLESEALRARHREEVIKYLDREAVELNHFREWCQDRETKEEDALMAAAVLPAEEKLEKILRYEAALDKKLYRAMDQLERLQRRRQGEEVPPPMTMEISAKA